MTGMLVVNATEHERRYGLAALLDLLPHRGCMLMLQRLTVHDASSFTGEACWEDDHPFVRALGSTFVPETLLVEAAAQTAGAGLVATEFSTGMPQGRNLGLLAGVRRCTFMHPVHTGLPVLLRATTRFMSPVLAHGLVEARQSDTVVASLQVLLAMPKAQA